MTSDPSPQHAVRPVLQRAERRPLAVRHSRNHEGTRREAFRRRCYGERGEQPSHLCSPVSQVLSLLTEQEVLTVVPAQAIVPRTFVLKPSMSLLVAGLARIDFLQVT